MTSDSAKTVQSELIFVLLPDRAIRHSSSGRTESVLAMTSRKRPVPAEHLSFITNSDTAPPLITISLVSCPPMSITFS